MIALLVDYGAGNLHSIRKALDRSGMRVRVTLDVARDLDGTDAIVLPGVGAFGTAAARLAPAMPAIRDALTGGMPCLGICLGMQLLFDGSDEGAGAGLGILPGRVQRLRSRRVPHMGWNTVESAASADALLAAGDTFYFANGFVVRPADERDVVGWTEHEESRFPAAVRRGNTFGVQFHPEKSGSPGLRLLERFVDFARGSRTCTANTPSTVAP